MSTRSSFSVALISLALSAIAFVGCAQDQACSGLNCTCNSGACVSSCPAGGCNYQCRGSTCDLTCTGNGCNLDCAPGATSCILRGCTSNCRVTCNGAATCETSCGDTGAGCTTAP